MGSRRVLALVLGSVIPLLGCGKVDEVLGRAATPTPEIPVTDTASVATATPTPAPGAGISITMADPPGRDDAVAVMAARMEAKARAEGGYPTPTPTVVPIQRREDGTVLAPALGLQWTASAGGTFSEADAAVWCEGLVLAGHDDWRLPTRDELAAVLATGFQPGARGTALKLWTATPHHARGFLAYDRAAAEFEMLDAGLAHALCVRGSG